MKRCYAAVPDGQMHYRFEGKGQVILLLHMALSSSDEYEKVSPFLSGKYQVIAPDFMGYGESDKPGHPYSIEEHARSIIELMDALGIEKANIVGHHVSSMVSVAIAVGWPGRVTKLILSSLPYSDEIETIKAGGTNNTSPVEIKPDGSHLMEWWRRSARYGDSPEVIDARTLCMHKAGPGGEHIYDALRLYSPVLKQVFPQIKSPTLVIAPTRDSLGARQAGVQRMIPGSRLVSIEGGPTYLARVMPREFAEAILRFLD
jgi:pimeloyl-ACP methyl ester carboxylesterase